MPEQPLRVIIAGSRTINADHPRALEALHVVVVASGFDIGCVVSGGARGADDLGERYARWRGLSLQVYPADWKTLGKRAGPIRNEQMAENADALIALWDGDSPGTRHMIETARTRGLLVHVHRFER